MSVAPASTRPLPSAKVLFRRARLVESVDHISGGLPLRRPGRTFEGHKWLEHVVTATIVIVAALLWVTE